MREFFMGLFGDGMAAQYGTALWDTLKITLLSTILAYIIGVPLGILLYGTAKDSIFPNRTINSVTGVIVNIIRSVPFIILLVMIIFKDKAVRTSKAQKQLLQKILS